MSTETIKKIKNGAYSFNMGSLLGKGSFGNVYKGTITSTGETVAIKCVSRHLIEQYGDALKNALNNEIRILNQLKTMNSPFLLKTYDTVESPNNIYIVLEYCNEGTAQDVLEKHKGALPEQLALDIVYQVVLGLCALGEFNITHRDLKPENIFIRNNIFKLGDFGFSTDKGTMQSTLGTPPYMAPEFYTSDWYGQSVDIWAVGVILHQFIFGEIYFIGANSEDVKNKILNKKYEITKKTPVIKPATRDLLYKILEKDPRKRITILALKEHPAFIESSKKFDKFMDVGFVSRFPAALRNNQNQDKSQYPGSAEANPYQPQPSPYQPQPSPYQPQQNPYGTVPNPYQPQPSPYQPQPSPYQPQQNPYQPQPSPYQPKPSPYENLYPQISGGEFQAIGPIKNSQAGGYPQGGGYSQAGGNLGNSAKPAPANPSSNASALPAKNGNLSLSEIADLVLNARNFFVSFGLVARQLVGEFNSESFNASFLPLLLLKYSVQSLAEMVYVIGTQSSDKHKTFGGNKLSSSVLKAFWKSKPQILIEKQLVLDLKAFRDDFIAFLDKVKAKTQGNSIMSENLNIDITAALDLTIEKSVGKLRTLADSFPPNQRANLFRVLIKLKIFQSYFKFDEIEPGMSNQYSQLESMDLETLQGMFDSLECK